MSQELSFVYPDVETAQKDLSSAFREVRFLPPTDLLICVGSSCQRFWKGELNRAFAERFGVSLPEISILDETQRAIEISLDGVKANIGISPMGCQGVCDDSGAICVVNGSPIVDRCYHLGALGEGYSNKDTFLSALSEHVRRKIAENK